MLAKISNVGLLDLSFISFNIFFHFILMLIDFFFMAQKALYNVWTSTLAMWDSVCKMRISLQQLKLELKLNAVLNDQVISPCHGPTILQPYLIFISVLSGF